MMALRSGCCVVVLNDSEAGAAQGGREVGVREKVMSDEAVAMATKTAGRQRALGDSPQMVTTAMPSRSGGQRRQGWSPVSVLPPEIC